MTGFIAGGFCMALLFVALKWFRDYDDSDAPPQRSGLCVHTDAKTGVQYLSTSGGGVTPRLNSDGSLLVVVKPESP